MHGGIATIYGKAVGGRMGLVEEEIPESQELYHEKLYMCIYISQANERDHQEHTKLERYSSLIDWKS